MSKKTALHSAVEKGYENIVKLIIGKSYLIIFVVVDYKSMQIGFEQLGSTADFI